jgi:hypothetical protein
VIWNKSLPVGGTARAQDLFRRQSSAAVFWHSQSGHQIAAHLLNNLLLIVNKVGNRLQQRLQAHALSHQFPIHKTDLPRRRSRHPSVLLLACGFALRTLQGLDVAWCGLKQQLL